MVFDSGPNFGFKHPDSLNHVSHEKDGNLVDFRISSGFHSAR